MVKKHCLAVGYNKFIFIAITMLCKSFVEIAGFNEDM